METAIKIIEEFDVNNIGVLMAVSIVLISVMASYIQLFNASKIETVLMNKNEESKRFVFVYIVFFFLFGVVNYLFTMNISIVVVNGVFLALTLITSFILKILKNKGKAEKLYWQFEERKDIVIVMTSISIIVYVISIGLDVNIISCSILGALVEVIIIAIMFLHVGNIRTFIFINIANEKWYVFKRIDENYLLCGNKSNINDSTKTKLLAIDYLVEQNMSFESELTDDR